MQLVSAFRLRRRRVCLNRAHFQNHPWARALHSAESLFETAGTMYHSVLSLFHANLFGCSLHHLCWPRFLNSNRWGSTHLIWFFSKLPPVAGPIGYKSDIRIKMLIKFLVSLQRKLRVRWTRKKNCLAIACTKLHCPTDHSIFFLLKFYLNLSWIWWQPDGKKEIKIVWFAKIWKPQRQDMALLRIGKIMAIRKNLAKFWKLGVALILQDLLTGFFA